MKNNNCDGDGPCDMGEVRVLPILGSNYILCSKCFDREINHQREVNWKNKLNKLNLDPVPLPSWWECERYLVNES